MKIQDLQLIQEAKQSTSSLKPGQKKTIMKGVDGKNDIFSLQQNVSDYKRSIRDYEEQLREYQKKLKQAQDKLEKMHSNTKQSKYQSQLTELARKIQSECGSYLKIFQKTGKYLFRGTSDHGGSYEGRSRINRKPLDSNDESTKQFDQAASQLGIQALRVNSIFTTADMSVAEQYGDEVYAIFPKNSAVYSWSRNYNDLVIDIDSLDDFRSQKKDHPVVNAELKNSNKQIQQMEKLLDKEEEFSKKHKQIIQQLDKLYEYQDKLADLLSEYLSYDAKISLKWIQKNFPQSPVTKEFQKIWDYLDLPTPINLNQFQKHYQLTNESLEIALKKRHEVLISGEYIAVRMDLWKRLRDQKLI